MASLPRSHHHLYDHGNKDQHQAWLLWNPRREHTNEHCPHSRGLGWGRGVPTASAVTTRFAPTLQHNSVQHRTDSQINLCNRDWKMHCANFRNLHFSTNMGTSQSEDAHCRAGNVPLNQSSSDREAITLEVLTDFVSLPVLQRICRFIRGLPLPHSLD